MVENIEVKVKSLFGEHDLGRVRLCPGCRVLVNNAGFRGLVHGGRVGVSGRFGGFLVFTRRCGDELFVEGFEAGLGRLVARGQANRLTGSLDGGFCVGHG